MPDNDVKPNVNNIPVMEPPTTSVTWDWVKYIFNCVSVGVVILQQSWEIAYKSEQIKIPVPGFVSVMALFFLIYTARSNSVFNPPTNANK